MNSDQTKEPTESSDHPFIVSSILDIKASEECTKSVASDLSLEDNNNKSIAELLDEEKNTQEKNNQENNQE